LPRVRIPDFACAPLGPLATGILILTGLAGIEDKVRGLGFGADDYMTKPFHKDELVARIHAIVRRSKGHAQSVIQTGDLVVNLDTKTVEVNGARVHLTGKEYQMLELLSLRKGTTLTKEMFLNHLYGGMDEPEIKRRFHLQTAQEARWPVEWQGLHRDGVGSRLRAARAVRGRGEDFRLSFQGAVNSNGQRGRQHKTNHRRPPFADFSVTGGGSALRDGNTVMAKAAAVNKARRVLAASYADAHVVQALSGGDPVRSGLVASLNRPGGNLTGVTNLSIELGPKRLELLREVVPQAALMGILSSPMALSNVGSMSDLQAAARSVGQEIVILNARRNKSTPPLQLRLHAASARCWSIPPFPISLATAEIKSQRLPSP
jgi:CheY-like chemotaxis protein